MDQRKRLLSKVDDINRYLHELDSIEISSLEEYKRSVAKKRASERLLQIMIEAVVDISYILYSGENLGVPKDDDSVVKALYEKKIISKEIMDLISELKGFRNILVHKYGAVDDELVFENLTENLSDFEKLRDYFLNMLK